MACVGATVLKLNTCPRPCCPGGSSVSVSLTPVSSTVTVHVSSVAKSEDGSSVYVVRPPLRAKECEPLVAHSMEKVAVPTETGSLNVTSTFAVVGTSIAPAAGEVAATNGAASGGGPP